MGKWKNYLNAEQINPVIVSQLSIVDNTTLAPPVARDNLNQNTNAPPTYNELRGPSSLHPLSIPSLTNWHDTGHRGTLLFKYLDSTSVFCLCLKQANYAGGLG